MNTGIRAAAAGDLADITAIYAGHVRHGSASFETEPPSLAEMARRHAGITEAGHPWLVAVRDRAVLGYAYAGPYRMRPAYRWTVEDSVYLAPEATGQGIGRSLLVALLTAAEQRGFRQMVAVIGDSRSHASIGLHRTLGFTPAGVLRAVGFKHGGWVDSVLMQRALGEGFATPPQALAA